MSFQQGLSGLNAASKSLDVIGNNVANANTVGFKQSRAEFADVYANALNGSGTGSAGIGVKVADIQRQFTQGNITNTENPLDIAINGNGFFRLSNSGAITYSRNGQFQLDKAGYIVTSSGERLTGYVADTNGALQTGALTDIKISSADLAPQASTKVNDVFNLDSRSAVLPIASFNPADPTTYTQVVPISVYDSQGNPHTLQSYLIKTAANTWSVRTTVDGGTTAVGSSTLTFDTNGLLTGTTTQAVTLAPPTVPASQAITIDFASSTQFGSDYSLNSQVQDGYASGRLSSFSTAADGTIIGRYTNGQAKALAQVVLAKFANPNGLSALGNNQFAETADAGVPVIGKAGTGGLGTLQSSATEDSNVDLTAELVNMITAQRYYQANAQTIKTQDQVLQTLVNLR
ncbi:flagellar hook protein FlgE [Methylovorus sp. MP688]|uniref:flagellar hook protein FlgE n=1 Tax=Methylovorus sp. (strain MP688) TaxID=887061 RepID=UPI0001EC44F9|nr:flagellar hook protein FlgE [Methylovorus sp. MP688]ADQ83985.1 flagellar basal body FlaE domain protein [Methylovorus sp. MP688]